MKAHLNRIVSVLASTITITAGSPLTAQANKKVLTMEDYGLWRTVTSTQLSGDGAWMTYDYRKPEAAEDAPDERNLKIRHLTSDKLYEVRFAVSPAFSDDSGWVAYSIDLNRKEAKKLNDQKKPVRRQVQLLNLKTGDKFTWENASSFAFSKSSDFLAIRKPRTKSAEHAGHDLIIHDLERHLDHHFGSVSSYQFNKPGTLLAYTRDAADKTANGLYVMNLQSGVRTPLDQEASIYSRMTWDENGTALAALKGNKNDKLLHQENQLIAFTGLTTNSPTKHALAPTHDRDFPKNMVISEKARLSWNTNASKVFFGIKAQAANPKPAKPKGARKEHKNSAERKEAPRPDLDIWHWKDTRIQSVQRSRANRERNFTFRAVYNLEAKLFVQLADKTMRTITVTRDGKWGVGTDEREYIHDWKQPRADYYRVDTSTGKRRPMLTGLKRSLGVSPDSRHFAYWHDTHVWVYDLDSADAVNLTKKAAVSFVHAEYDFAAETPPYGVSGWTKDGKGIVLNHRYDLWHQPLDGGPAINLTSGVGAANDIRFRYAKMDRDEKFIDLSKPIILSAYGQWTKKSGFYKLNAGGAATGSINKPERLIFAGNSFRRLVKAKHSDRFMFTIESFRKCPDYYVADATFDAPRRITDANPQQQKYNWGHRVLFDYTNKDGVRLQASLAIPDTRKPDQRLPMLVSFYEKRSQNMHRYLRPRFASNPISDLMQVVSDGYLILSPDIHFNVGTSIENMWECIEIAVDKAIELGYADPDRVALCGHSYSGYGGVYIAARSKKFAAGVVMAGVVNYISDFNHLWGYEADRKVGSGGVNAHRYNVYEQGRMGTNPYDNHDLFWSQSPIAHVKGMTTPLLCIHGESDNTVAWIESVELYNAMRFNGKNIIFLSYANEGHSLSRRVNKRDLTRRMLEYYDHHLKGKPAPDWITKGVPFLDKAK